MIAATECVSGSSQGQESRAIQLVCSWELVIGETKLTRPQQVQRRGEADLEGTVVSEEVRLALRAADFGVALLVMYQEASASQHWGTADSWAERSQ